jgi:hypothetical protein
VVDVGQTGVERDLGRWSCCSALNLLTVRVLRSGFGGSTCGRNQCLDVLAQSMYTAVELATPRIYDDILVVVI